MIPFGTQKAPSPSAVLPFYVTAAIAFAVLTALMLISSVSFTGHYFQPHILAITHLAALGWGTMLIFGASHQLLPVVMEVHLFSEKLARWCYFLLLPGIVLLAVSFWVFDVGVSMELGALLILSAVTLYAINVYRTARQNSKWTITAECIVTASGWLWLTVLLGTLLVFNFRYPFFPRDSLYYLKIHAHLGMAGWFLLLVMGVASRLIPLFLLSHQEPGRQVGIAYYCINGALIGFVVMAFLFHTEKYWPVFAVVALAGVISYGLFVRRAWEGAVRKKMDMPMKITMTAIVLMIVPFLLLAVLAFLSPGRQAVAFSLAYGISILGGFITAIMLGQTFKTLPFIVWMHRYKKLIGKTKTPLPRELYRDGWIHAQFYAYLLGYAALITGVLTHVPWLITVGCAALFITAVCYNVNVLMTVAHRAPKPAEAKIKSNELGN
jgi:hypothetical protein